MTISGIVIAKNEQDLIRDCLSSLKFCDEIIVIDNGSTDKTSQIAKEKKANVIEVDTDDFSKLRVEGLRNSKSEWVLYVDADERVTEDLAREIKEKLENPGKYIAFKIKRKNFYLGNHEWPYIERPIKLFRKKNLKSWIGKLHESPLVEGEVGELNNFLLHFTHRNLSQMLAKTIQWSEIEADIRFKNNHPVMSLWRFPRVMISAFFNSYLKQGGYKAGTVGLIESIYQSFSIFITYAKLWEKQLDKKS
ncbi:MAG: glycosyltransferase family 2 protein [Patescibacteria group bacterium]